MASTPSLICLLTVRQYEQAGTALTPNMSTAFRPACLYCMLGAVYYEIL
jgi:hypothetical protein